MFLSQMLVQLIMHHELSPVIGQFGKRIAFRKAGASSSSGGASGVIKKTIVALADLFGST